MVGPTTSGSGPSSRAPAPASIVGRCGEDGGAADVAGGGDPRGPPSAAGQLPQPGPSCRVLREQLRPGEEAARTVLSTVPGHARGEREGVGPAPPGPLVWPPLSPPTSPPVPRSLLAGVFLTSRFYSPVSRFPGKSFPRPTEPALGLRVHARPDSPRPPCRLMFALRH